MVDDPEGRASDFDDKIPAEHTTESEIKDYMDDNFGHVLPQDFIDAVAPHVENIRDDTGSDIGITTTSDAVWDSDAGAFRDPETGQFVSPDDT